MIYYALFGVLVTMFSDFLMKLTEKEELQFNNWERVFLILIWPAVVLFYIITLIRNLSNKE